MKINRYVGPLAIAVCLVLGYGSSFCASIGYSIGAQYYFRHAESYMEGYREEYGFYPKTIGELESYAHAWTSVLERTKGEDYTYKIIDATDDSYHIITENSKGLRNYELTSNVKRAMWVYKNEEDRQNTKTQLMLQIKEIAAPQSPITDNTSILYLEYFPDEDTKEFLISLCGRMGSSEKEYDIKFHALLALGVIISESDSSLIPALVTIYESLPGLSLAKLTIIEMLGVLRSKTTLTFLEEIVADVAENEKLYTPVLMKEAALRAIAAIRSVKGK